VAVEDKKIGKRLVDARDVTLAPGITLVTDSFANKNPHLVVKYIRACAKAMKYLITNFDESLDILTKEWNRPKDITKAAMQRFFYDPRITKEVMDSWKEEAEFLYAEKKIKEIPNWNTFIDTRYLNEAIKGMVFTSPYVPGSVYLKK
jgi:sulfonate transport system substrate-binding protein